MRFFQSNHEGEFVEELHGRRTTPTRLMLNPGAWTHYAWAIRDALEICGLPAVEVHLSDIDSARGVAATCRSSRDLCMATVAGKGVDGYREALAALKEALADEPRRPRRRAARRARARPAARHRPRQPALPDGLHRHATACASSGPDVRRFVTDFRYVEQAAAQVAGFEREHGPQDFLEALGDGWPEGELRLGFEDDHMTVRRHARLRELVPERIELVAAGGLVEAERAVKEPAELDAIRAAAALADDALRDVLFEGLVGRTERAVALAIEDGMRRRGAEPSFDSIVASGTHGALPHAVPREEEIAENTLVTIDWGARLDGYCSDCTRTFATGPLDGALARSTRSSSARRRGPGRRSTGPPRPRGGRGGARPDRRRRPRRALRPRPRPRRRPRGPRGVRGWRGPATSRCVRATSSPSSPGVYVPGLGGVRIEDLVVVTDTGHEVLTGLTKALTVVS